MPQTFKGRNVLPTAWVRRCYARTAKQRPEKNVNVLLSLHHLLYSHSSGLGEGTQSLCIKLCPQTAHLYNNMLRRRVLCTGGQWLLKGDYRGD